MQRDASATIMRHALLFLALVALASLHTALAVRRLDALAGTQRHGVLPAAPSGLPPGWEIRVDQSSGESYYHNKLTGQSQLEKPPPPAVPAPSPPAPGAGSAKVYMVSDVADCEYTVWYLLNYSHRIAVDLEGDSLSRTGRLCLLQVAVQVAEGSNTYLFDVCTLGAAGFEDGRLQELLEDASLQKAFWDLHNDVDALYYQFCVRVRGALDVQILYAYTHQDRNDFYLTRLDHAVEKYGSLRGWTEREQNRMMDVKERGRRRFALQPSVWCERPLPSELVIYAAYDVKHLLGMVEAWGDPIPSKLRDVRQETELRIAKTLATPHRIQDGFIDLDFRSYGRDMSASLRTSLGVYADDGGYYADY